MWTLYSFRASFAFVSSVAVNCIIYITCSERVWRLVLSDSTCLQLVKMYSLQRLLCYSNVSVNFESSIKARLKFKTPWSTFHQVLLDIPFKIWSSDSPNRFPEVYFPQSFSLLWFWTVFLSFPLSTPAAVGFLTVSSAVTMSAPFLLGKVIDTIYASGADTEAMTASLTSLCIMLAGVFLCGGAANAARVYLMQTSGETSREINTLQGHMKNHRHEEDPKFRQKFRKSHSTGHTANTKHKHTCGISLYLLQESTGNNDFQCLVYQYILTLKNTLKVWEICSLSCR